MRLFCGLSLPYQVRRNLELLLEHLRPQANINWSPPANLHITTKFIGHWPDADLPKMIEQLKTVPRPGELEINVRGLGWFPNPHQPRVLFAGIVAPEALAQLHADTDRATAALGVATESKPYSPHLTLARIKEKPDLAPLRRAIAELPSTDFGKFTAAKHLLYQSQPNPKGSVYTVVGEFPLE